MSGRRAGLAPALSGRACDAGASGAAGLRRQTDARLAGRLAAGLRTQPAARRTPRGGVLTDFASGAPGGGAPCVRRGASAASAPRGCGAPNRATPSHGAPSSAVRAAYHDVAGELALVAAAVGEEEDALALLPEHAAARGRASRASADRFATPKRVAQVQARQAYRAGR